MEKDLMYHYTKYESAISIIENKNIRLSSSLGMNDKTDRFFANLYATALILTSKDSVITGLRTHLEIDDIINANLKSLQIPFYSASFCERADNQHLWSNYANNHSGVCMAFNKEYLLRQMRMVLSDNFIPFDSDEKADEYIEYIVPLRSVYYKEAEQFVTEVIKKTRPSEEYIKSSPFAYKHWLVMVYSIIAGVIKADKFKHEEEIRLLFQDTYSSDYIETSPMRLFDYERLKKGLSELGLSNLVQNDRKEYYELKLEKFFTSELIPEIVLGKNFLPQNIEPLKNFLKNNGLVNTVVDDRFCNK